VQQEKQAWPDSEVLMPECSDRLFEMSAFLTLPCHKLSVVNYHRMRRGRFLASDHPVVQYNQLMEFSRFGSNTGLVSKGLQISFRLTPTLLLMMSDTDIVVGDRRSSVHQ
jgi:hypothetical protein